MNEPRELILLGKAARALAEANSIDEVKDLRDQAAMVTAYAKKARLGHDLVVEASTFKVRAERKLGEMLRVTELANSAPGNQYTKPGDGNSDPQAPLTLRQLGITKSDSSRTQQIAALPEDAFEGYIARCKESGREPTGAALLRLSKQRQATGETAPSVCTQDGPADSSALLAAGGRKFATGYVDPPWNQTGAPGSPAGSSPSVDDVCRLPVVDLFEDRAHLHVWSSPSFLLAGLDVLEAWGFQYRSCLVCTFPPVGSSRHWRTAHAFLLLGVRGSRPFEKVDRASWLQLESHRQDLRQEILLELIEEVSPGPYVQLFAETTTTRPKWTVCPVQGSLK